MRLSAAVNVGITEAAAEVSQGRSVRSSLRLRAWVIALVYAAVATFWIYFSDAALMALVGDPELMVQWSVNKGIAFVLVTALLLLLTMRRAFGKIGEGYEALKVREEERQRAEALARREAVFSATMIESMPGILYFYNEQGKFLRWNRNFEAVSGYTGEEIAEMHPLDFFASEDQRPLEERIAEVFAQGESYVEAPFRAKDGTLTPYFFTGRRVDYDGRRCLVGVGIDISERKAAEQKLRELNETLERKVAERTVDVQKALVRAEAADRLKSAFLATMSHELRTPLNSIIGFTGILLQGLAGPLNEEQQKQMGMVRGSARHLLELINDVLDLSKIEAGQLDVRKERFDLREVTGRVVETLRPMAEKKGLRLETELADAVGAAVGDRRRVEQILLNLVNNGIKFTETGSVTLKADVVADFIPTAADAPAGRAVRLRVADTGMGIKPGDLGNLFLPFRQIDTGLARQHEGTGLGLAICRRLAGLMGGEISVSSEMGRGSEFTVILPLGLEADAEATSSEAIT